MELAVLALLLGRLGPLRTGADARGDTVTVETVRPADGAKLPFTISYGDEADTTPGRCWTHESATAATLWPVSSATSSSVLEGMFV